jgi:hypothetical protein
MSDKAGDIGQISSEIDIQAYRQSRCDEGGLFAYAKKQQAEAEEEEKKKAAAAADAAKKQQK